MNYLSKIVCLIARLFPTSLRIVHPRSGRPRFSYQLTQRRPLVLMLAALIVLLFAQPLLVSANSATRARGQLAGLAQLEETAAPDEEAADDNDDTDDNNTGDGDNDNGNAEDGDAADNETDDEAATATAIAEEVNAETPSPDQINIALPTAESIDESTDVITVEVPIEARAETPAAADEDLLFSWQGETTINAQELGEVAPPLQAEVLQGEFQISYVAASDASASLRILPVSAPGTLRMGIRVDGESSIQPFPAGETLQLQLTARVYAPDGNARLIIADNLGSSSVVLDGLNWTDYQVTRQIDANTTSVELLVEWSNVPANGWLEMRDFALARQTSTAALSPTDTPALVEAVALAPTAPPPTSTPTSAPLATATALPTATPVPDVIAQATDEDSPAESEITAPAVVTDTVVLTPTPTLIVVTSTPTPVDVFEEATRVAQATEWARILGPATSTPENLATPTPTSTPFIIVVVDTPIPENMATATHAALWVTAEAFTTGTATPVPPEATIATATPTVPRPTNTPRPTATPTPLFVLLDNLPVNAPAPVPTVPGEFYGKIVFLTDFRGDPRRPNAMIMNPDGSEVGLLTTNTFYSLAAARDAYSADNRFYVYNLREAGGEAHNSGRFQLFYNDTLYNSFQHQLTYFGAGVAWSPVWSPRSETVAFVSSESGNDEIWVMERGNWPARQLTNNEWEWDHHPSFSPDGSEIVFSSNRATGHRQIWIMSSGGDNQRQITNFAAFEAWDPVWVKYVEGQ